MEQAAPSPLAVGKITSTSIRDFRTSLWKTIVWCWPLWLIVTPLLALFIFPSFNQVDPLHSSYPFIIQIIELLELLSRVNIIFLTVKAVLIFLTFDVVCYGYLNRKLNRPDQPSYLSSLKRKVPYIFRLYNIVVTLIFSIVTTVLRFIVYGGVNPSDDLGDAIFNLVISSAELLITWLLLLTILPLLICNDSKPFRTNLSYIKSHIKVLILTCLVWFITWILFSLLAGFFSYVVYTLSSSMFELISGATAKTASYSILLMLLLIFNVVWSNLYFAAFTGNIYLKLKELYLHKQKSANENKTD